jgi:PAS domain S-box-containing protein
MQARNLTELPLRILHLEDSSVDAEIVRRQLTRANLHAEILRVEERADFLEVLQQQRIDLILADRRLATFDGFEALELAVKLAPDIPFIFVSGELGEELAVSSLQQGATDYVLKDRLSRLGAAVRRGLREASERRLRKEADERLRRSQQELADFFEHAPMGLNWTDVNGRILKANQAELEMFGYSSEEYLGHSLTEFHEDKKALENVFAQLAEGKTIHNFEARVRCKDGQIKDVVIQKNGLWENGKFIHARSFTLDVTARLNLEAQLQQSKKMESVGQLASGIAHDFNNLLSVITSHSKLILAKENLLQNVSEPVGEIFEAANRAAELTRQLLAFSRKQVLNLQATDFNQIIKNISRMLQHILGKKTLLKLELSPRLPAVNVDAGAIEKVLVNLAFNSRDAMPDGGEVRLNTSSVTFDESDVQNRSGAVAGEYLCLKFSDNGQGISPENLGRIFEPFFTTKEVDRGTGLGLATVYGIIEQHRGWIEVESRAREGTTLSIFLPEWGRVSQSFLPGYDETLDALSEKVGLPQSFGGTETILVVENESPLRHLIRHVLQARGYKIVEASTGKEALEKFSSGKIDLLLIDLSQEETGGARFAKKLHALNPNLKIVQMNEGERAKAESHPDLNINAHLRKPFHARTLAETVYRALNSKN